MSGHVYRALELAGGSFVATARLISDPKGTVNFTVVQDYPAFTPYPATLVFTSANWNVPQTVVFTSQKDLIACEFLTVLTSSQTLILFS